VKREGGHIKHVEPIAAEAPKLPLEHVTVCQGGLERFQSRSKRPIGVGYF
jgi:hypothetical protein